MMSTEMDSVRVRSQYLLRIRDLLNSRTLQSTRVFKYRAVHFAIEFLRVEHVGQRLFGILPDQGVLTVHCTASLLRYAHFANIKDHRITQRNIIYHYLPLFNLISQSARLLLILHSFILILKIAIFFCTPYNYFIWKLLMLFATFIELFDNSKRCGCRCRPCRSYVDSSTSFMMLPDDPVLSREHYMHPHPVNRERNVSQVVTLYFYACDVGRRETTMGLG